MSQGNQTTTGTTSARGETYKQQISRKKELFLLFYTKGNHRGDALMYYAAKTRRQNIERQPWFDSRFHLVFNVPIQSMSEVVETVPLSITKRGGREHVRVKEINIFSHAWYDGPTGSIRSRRAPVSNAQMDISGGWDSIDYNWANNARFVMFGCNSATDEEGERVFAKELSANPKFHDVTVWGQPSGAYPSLYPDKRETVIARSFNWEGDDGTIKDWNAGWAAGSACYMVAGVKGQGVGAHRGVPFLSAEAKPMKKYKNGVLIGRSHQSEFNTHL